MLVVANPRRRLNLYKNALSDKMDEAFVVRDSHDSEARQEKGPQLGHPLPPILAIRLTLE